MESLLAEVLATALALLLEALLVRAACVLAARVLTARAPRTAS